MAQSDTEGGKVLRQRHHRRSTNHGGHFETKTAPNGLRFFIFVPAKLERLEQTEKYDYTMQVSAVLKYILKHIYVKDILTT